MLFAYYIYFTGIAFLCDAGEIKMSDICSVRYGIPTTTQFLIVGGDWVEGGGVSCVHVRCQF